MFLIYARDLIEVLDVGDGWEVEYPRDEWRVSRLPGVTINPSRPRARSYLRFGGISQPWLKVWGSNIGFGLDLQVCGA